MSFQRLSPLLRVLSNRLFSRSLFTLEFLTPKAASYLQVPPQEW